jgi:hypothetical protein
LSCAREGDPSIALPANNVVRTNNGTCFKFDERNISFDEESCMFSI